MLRSRPAPETTAAVPHESTVAAPAQVSRPRRRWPTVLKTLGGLVGMTVAVVLAANLITKADADAQVARARRLGAPVTVAQYVGAPIPAAQNAWYDMPRLERALGPDKKELSEFSPAEIERVREVVGQMAARGHLRRPIEPGTNLFGVTWSHLAKVKTAARVLGADSERAARRGDGQRLADNLKLLRQMRGMVGEEPNPFAYLHTVALNAIELRAMQRALKIDASPAMLDTVQRSLNASPRMPLVTPYLGAESLMIIEATDSPERFRVSIAMFGFGDQTGNVRENRWEDLGRMVDEIPGVDFFRWYVRAASLRRLNELYAAAQGATNPAELADRVVPVAAASRDRSGILSLTGVEGDLKEETGTAVGADELRRATQAMIDVLRERARTGQLPKTGPPGYVRSADGKAFTIVRPIRNLPDKITVTWPQLGTPAPPR